MKDDDHRSSGHFIELLTPGSQRSQQDSLLASVRIEDLERVLVSIVATDALGPSHRSAIEPFREPLRYIGSIELRANSGLHLGPAYRDGTSRAVASSSDNS